MAASAPTPSAFPPSAVLGSSWGGRDDLSGGGSTPPYSSSPASRELRWSHQDLRPSAQATLATRHATQIISSPAPSASDQRRALRQGDSDEEEEEEGADDDNDGAEGGHANGAALRVSGDGSEGSDNEQAAGRSGSAALPRRTSVLFEKRRATRAAHSLTLTAGGTKVTVDVERLVADMAHPAAGVPVRDRKWRLRTYRKCFVGSEAVDWLMNKLKLDGTPPRLSSAHAHVRVISPVASPIIADRADAVSVGQEIMRLQYFRHVVDDARTFEDSYLFYAFLGAGGAEEALGVRSMEELVTLLRQPDSGLPIMDRKWHFKTYPSCLVGAELVDWLMCHLPLRSRKEAVQIGNRLLNEGYLESVVEPGKPFKDHYLFYAFGAGPSSSSTTLASSPPSAAPIGDRDESEPCLDDFELLKVLGVGAFGKVLMVRRKKTGAIYAMKALNKKDVAGSERVCPLPACSRLCHPSSPNGGHVCTTGSAQSKGREEHPLQRASIPGPSSLFIPNTGEALPRDGLHRRRRSLLPPSTKGPVRHTRTQ